MNILYKTTKGEVINKNLEIIYDYFKFNSINGIEFKVDDGMGSGYKMLWKKSNCKDVGIYADNKLQTILFPNLESSYIYLLKNKDKLYSNNKKIQIRCNKGKTQLSSLSSIELEAVVDLLNVLKKHDIIDKSFKSTKSDLDLKPIYTFQEKNKINKANKTIINKEIAKIKKRFVVKIEFANSSIIKTPSNSENYKEALNLYKSCKETFPQEKISLLRLEGDNEKVLYSKDNRSIRKLNKQIKLLEDLTSICKELSVSRESLTSALSVIDKAIDIAKHEIEVKTFNEDLMEYKLIVDRLKSLLDERRDIKKAIIINGKCLSEFNLCSLENKLESTTKSMSKRDKGVDDYIDGKVDINVYKYKDAEEYEKISAYFSDRTVRNNPEENELHVYNKHYK